MARVSLGAGVRVFRSRGFLPTRALLAAAQQRGPGERLRHAWDYRARTRFWEGSGREAAVTLGEQAGTCRLGWGFRAPSR